MRLRSFLCTLMRLCSFFVYINFLRLSVCARSANLPCYWGSWLLDWSLRCFSDIDRNSTNKCSYAFSFLGAKHREPQSSNAKLFLPIIPIGIVANAFSLLWDNLCWNSSIFEGLATQRSRMGYQRRQGSPDVFVFNWWMELAQSTLGLFELYQLV